MAKKLAFEQLPGNGGAIDANRWAIFASAAAVDFMGDQFFACSGLAKISTEASVGATTSI